MSGRTLIDRARGAARHYGRQFARPVMRVAASNHYLRDAINRRHLAMSWQSRSEFHETFAKVFYPDHSGGNGTWLTQFCGNTIRMPLDAETFARDWDLAVSITAHDWEVKQAYEILIRQGEIDLFVDIGANFGTHSLLFLSCGIRTISFEPNGECCSHFKALADLNGLPREIHNVALGSAEGQATLRFPKGRTWMGSIKLDPGGNDIVEQKVEVHTLDSYKLGGRMLIKIDAEGAELDILAGAADMLKTFKPKIIFESFDTKERQRFVDFFSNHDYRICSLPLGNSEPFLRSAATNFIAMPND